MVCLIRGHHRLSDSIARKAGSYRTFIIHNAALVRKAVLYLSGYLMQLRRVQTHALTPFLIA